jgi:isopenicillin N synthase-like dioxygenase
MEHMKNIGTVLMHAIIDSLDMIEGHPIDKEIFSDPTTLFRIFNYPPHDPENHPKDAVGVGEHTDYGYLTVLKQDQSGGLQMRLTDNSIDPEVKLDKWMDVKYIDNSFVINIGDALERMTHALYRATSHRVIQRTNAKSSRLSFPYFFDPSFDSEMTDVGTFLTERDMEHAEKNQLHVTDRWDKQDPAQFYGTYGEYLTGKVSKVFPVLAEMNIHKPSSKIKSLNRPSDERDPLLDFDYDEHTYNHEEIKNDFNEHEEYEL